MVLFFTFLGMLLEAQDIKGVWQKLDDYGKPQIIVAIYEYLGKFHGRIVGSFDEKGNIKETLEKPLDKATALKGMPFYTGLDLIWNLKKEGSEYTGGKIIDPTKGNAYSATAWLENDKLIVRGHLLFFGKNLHFTRLTNVSFKNPDPSTFILKIPEKA